MIPSADNIVICFAHVAYRLAGAVRGARDRHQQLRGPRPRNLGEPGGRSRRAGDLRAMAEPAPRSDDTAPLHSVDRRRHRPIPARRAGKARHPAIECPRRQCSRGRRARNGADAGLEPSSPGGPRQPGKVPLAGDDRRSRPTRGRTRRQDAPGRRPGRHRRTTGPAGQGFRYARHRAAAPPGFRARLCG